MSTISSHDLSCDGKLRFTNFAKATRAAVSLTRKRGNKDGWPMTAYHCRFCNGFHFGHTPAWERRSRKRR